MGSPEFAVPSLIRLVEAGCRVVGVVTQPDRPAGRGGLLRPPAVKVAAQDHGLAILQPETLKDEAARAAIAAFDADVFVVAAYGRILPRAVLAMPRRGSLNVHASLLPRWRGPSPVVAAILAGDAETGVSIMEVAPKMDAGPVVAQRTLAIGPSDTAGALEPRLAELGATMLVDVLPGWLDGSLTAVAQAEDNARYCPLLRKEDGWLAGTMTADEAERAVRAYDPWPGAYALYGGVRLGVWRAHVVAAERGEPGRLSVIEKSPAIAFEGGWLVLDEVQRTGSKRLPGRDFLNGLRGTLAPAVGLA